jgi:hypothetical protein
MRYDSETMSSFDPWLSLRPPEEVAPDATASSTASPVIDSPPYIIDMPEISPSASAIAFWPEVPPSAPSDLDVPLGEPAAEGLLGPVDPGAQYLIPEPADERTARRAAWYQHITGQSLEDAGQLAIVLAAIYQQASDPEVQARCITLFNDLALEQEPLSASRDDAYIRGYGWEVAKQIAALPPESAYALRPTYDEINFLLTVQLLGSIPRMAAAALDRLLAVKAGAAVAAKVGAKAAAEGVMKGEAQALLMARASSFGEGAAAEAVSGSGSVESGISNWITRPGVRLRKVGNYWIKEVNPDASAIEQWYGKGSIEAQAKGLDALGDMSPSHLFENGKLITRDVGSWQGGSTSGLWARGSWRLRTPFNDIRPGNIGANGLIFDPALHPVDQAIRGIGFGGSAGLLGYTGYEIWRAKEDR